jgi:membrane protease YdiL (CAAX protease family)
MGMRRDFRTEGRCAGGGRAGGRNFSAGAAHAADSPVRGAARSGAFARCEWSVRPDQLCRIGHETGRSQGPGGHFLLREGESLRTIGFDRTRPWPDLGRGAAIAAVIGSTGIAFYLAARGLGFNLTVVPEALPDVWWKYPVLILSAMQNAILEEVIVVGYLLRRLGQLGWTPGTALVASSVLRGSYHLYQGIGGFIGNMVMGVVFVYLYRRWGRVGPLVVAHSLLDIGAFVGYALLAGKVGWLPTA